MTRILYVQYANPGAYPPLHHSCRILAEAGCNIRVLGLIGDSTKILDLPEHSRIKVRRMAESKPGLAQKVRYLVFCFWVVWNALRWRPDWIYASDPFSAPAGRILSSFRRWKLLYHEHDSPDTDPNKTTSAFLKFVLRSRSKFAASADICVLPNQNRLEQFQRETKRHGQTLCVWNCPLRSEADIEVTERSESRVVLFYHGTIVPARLPLSVLRAIATIDSPVELSIVGYETIGHRGYVELLRRESAELKIADRIHFHGPLSRDDALRHCRQADVGLALMPSRPVDINERHMVGASNKPFDYMACGLALLVTDLPDWNELYVENGFGLACDPDNPKSIAAAIERFRLGRDETRAMGESGRQKILSDWNYETQFSAVKAHLLPEAGRERS